MVNKNKIKKCTIMSVKYRFQNVFISCLIVYQFDSFNATCNSFPMAHAKGGGTAFPT